MRRLTRKAWINTVGGNLLAMVVAVPTLTMSLSVYVPDVPFRQVVAAVLTTAIPFIVFVWIARWPMGRRIIRHRMRWFLEGRSASRSELERFAALPRVVAQTNTVGWALTPALLLPYLIHVEGFSLDGGEIARTIAGFAFGYVLGTALIYLLFERMFRPYLRSILPEDVAEWPASMGLGPRLLLAWFAIAGAPLLLIAFTLVGLTSAQRDQIVPAVRFAGALAAAFGLIVFVLAGRTLTSPLERLRSAQRRVAAGDLAVRLEIDEAAEIGQLEAGFNEMVDGLRTLASHNEELQAELRTQLQAVQESRVRIVEAADAERARIERNLHDGAQQRLLSLSFALRSAERDAREAGAERVETDVRTALREVDAAMSELRELARGIHPAILDEEGLGAALGSLAERTPVPTDLRTNLPGRLPPPVEVTAYFVVAESLANIAKYADASRATVCASLEDGTLRVTVADDGKGGADPMRGSGLRGLADRVAALGGDFEIESQPDRGTTVTAVIPHRTATAWLAP